MTKKLNAVAFFDIGGTLADVDVDPASGLVSRINVLPGVLDTLDRQRAAGARLGVISNIGEITDTSVAAVESALQQCGLADRLEPALVVFGAKDSPKIFTKAAERAGLATKPARCTFVGEDGAERANAEAAGMKSATPKTVFKHHA